MRPKNHFVQKHHILPFFFHNNFEKVQIASSQCPILECYFFLQIFFLKSTILKFLRVQNSYKYNPLAMFKDYLLLISNTRYLAERTIFSSNWSRPNDQILASLFQSRIPIQQSWLRDGIFRDPGDLGSGFLVLGWIEKSRNPGDRGRDSKIPKYRGSDVENLV